MAGAALLFAGASSAMDLIGGLFGYLASKEAAGAAESRARMIRMEADADAQRYAEQARGFNAKQRLAYLKSGVELSGSPLDVLDDDMLTAEANIASIRASGAARALGAEGEAAQARIGGRNALIAGISGGMGKVAMAAYSSGKTEGVADTNRKSVNPGGSGASGYYSDFLRSEFR